MPDSNLSEDLLAAILAMDSYNRGPSPGLEIPLSARNKIGEFDIVDSTSDGGFAAIAYRKGPDVVIAYRGTDFFERDPSTWFDAFQDAAFGWGTGVGLASEQSQQAVSFFERIQARISSSPTFAGVERIVLAGHSLGGGLAGFVASKDELSRSSVAAYIFDAMTYKSASYIKWQPNSPPSQIYTQSVDGEILQLLRQNAQTAAVAGAALGSSESQYVLAAGLSENGKIPFNLGSEVLNFIQLHSMPLLVLLNYADSFARKDVSEGGYASVGSPSNWRVSGVPDLLFSLLFDDNSGIPEAIELASAGELQSMLAYSVLDSGVRPFGDTAVRAMFNDAAELGAAKTIGSGFNLATIEAIETPIVRALLSFAGLLASEDIESSAHPLATAGILKLDQSGGALSIDVSDQTWLAQLGIADSVALASARQALSLASVDTSDEALDLELAQWLSVNDGDLAYIHHLTSAATTRIILPSLSGSEHQILIGRQGADSVTGSAGRDIVLVGNGANTVAGGGGNDFIWGGSQRDEVTGGADADFIYGGGGGDLLYGQAGDDQFLFATGWQGRNSAFGGDGADEARFGGAFNEYVITYIEQGTPVDGVARRVDISRVDDPNAVVTLDSIESVLFTDREISLRYSSVFGYMLEGGYLYSIAYDFTKTRITSFGIASDWGYAARDLATISVDSAGIVHASGGELAFGYGSYGGTHARFDPKINQFLSDSAAVANHGWRKGTFSASSSVNSQGEFVVSYNGELSGLYVKYNISSRATPYEIANYNLPSDTELEDFIETSLRLDAMDFDSTGNLYVSYNPAGFNDQFYIFKIDKAALSSQNWIRDSAARYTIPLQTGDDEIVDISFTSDGYLIGFAESRKVFEISLSTQSLTYLGNLGGNAAFAYDLDVVGSYRQLIAALANTDNPDLVIGTTGADDLDGGGGNDVLYGFAGPDMMRGGSGVDMLFGGQGADRLDGGSGYDFARYDDSAAGVFVRLDSGTGIGGDAQGDTLLAIEGLIGSAFADTLIGDSGSNALLGLGGTDHLYGFGSNDELYGFDGSDHLTGGAAGDRLDGGSGYDFARYDDAAAGVVADLASITNFGDYASGDTFIAIEALIGSTFADKLFGNEASNALLSLAGNDDLFGRGGNDELYGFDGNDSLQGGSGADQLDGGNGFDVARYDEATSGVTARLSNSVANAGEAAGDSYTSIEGLTGSDFADVLIGDAANNTIFGNGGDDVLFGFGGADGLVGGLGSDTFAFRAQDLSAGTYTFIADLGEEVGNFDRIFLEGFSDIITAQDGTDVLISTAALGFTGGIRIDNFSIAQLSDQVFIA